MLTIEDQIKAALAVQPWQTVAQLHGTIATTYDSLSTTLTRLWRLGELRRHKRGHRRIVPGPRQIYHYALPRRRDT